MQGQLEPRACFLELRGSCGRRGAAVGADEALLIHLLLTSCRAAGLLTGRTPIRVCGPGGWGTPAVCHGCNLCLLSKAERVGSSVPWPGVDCPVGPVPSFCWTLYYLVPLGCPRSLVPALSQGRQTGKHLMRLSWAVCLIQVCLHKVLG